MSIFDGLGPGSGPVVGVICGITFGIIFILIIAWIGYNYWRHSVARSKGGGGGVRGVTDSEKGSGSVRFGY